MCGRFNITDLSGLQPLLDDLDIPRRLPGPMYNVAPTEDIPLLRSGSVDFARWWLVPSWAKEISTRYSMFNARAESLSKSPAFRGPFRRQRGVVPMSSFIEWRNEQGQKQPWLITNDDYTLTVAALWDIWKGESAPLLSCTIVTTEAAEPFKPWHNRMPVILTREECRRWLYNSRAINTEDPMLAPVLKYNLLLNPVNRAVGNAANRDPDLFKPIGPQVVLESDQ